MQAIPPRSSTAAKPTHGPFSNTPPIPSARKSPTSPLASTTPPPTHNSLSNSLKTIWSSSTAIVSPNATTPRTNSSANKLSSTSSNNSQTPTPTLSFHNSSKNSLPFTPTT